MSNSTILNHAPTYVTVEESQYMLYLHIGQVAFASGQPLRNRITFAFKPANASDKTKGGEIKKAWFKKMQKTDLYDILKETGATIDSNETKNKAILRFTDLLESHGVRVFEPDYTRIMQYSHETMMLDNSYYYVGSDAYENASECKEAIPSDWSVLPDSPRF